MENKSTTINIYDFSIWCMASLYFFLPRRFYLLGMYSFRAILLGLLFLLVVNNHGRIEYKYKFMAVPSIFFLMAFFRYLIAGRLASGLGYLLDTVFLMVLMTNLIRTQREFSKYIKCYCNFIGLYSILGVIECVTGFNIWNILTGSSQLVYVRYALHRSYGSMTNFTNNAFFLLLSTVIVLWEIQNCKEIDRRKNIIVFILVNLNLFATLTRSAILLTLVFYLILLVRGGLLRFIKKHFVPIFIITVGIILVFLFSNATRNVMSMLVNMFLAIIDEDAAMSIKSEFGGNVGGVGNRFQLYDWVLESIKGKEVFGAGPKMFTYNWVRGDGIAMLKDSLENEYLSVLFRFGMVGLVLYLTMIFNFIVKIYRARRRLDSEISRIKRNMRWDSLVAIITPIYYLGGFFYAYADDSRLFLILMCLLYAFTANVIDSKEDIDNLMTENY